MTGAKLSEIIVGSTVGAFFLYISWMVLPLAWLRWVGAAMLAYEGWTLINRWTDDTLSEALVRLDERQPLIRLTFGIAVGWAWGLKMLDPLSTIVGLLLGHWFFRMHPQVKTVETTRTTDGTVSKVETTVTAGAGTTVDLADERRP